MTTIVPDYLKGKKVLLADDFPEMRELFEIILKHNGFEVTTASNGQEAIDHFLETPHDILIVDIFMPVKDGLQVIKELTLAFQDIKIIAITGGSEEHQNEVANYLQKANRQGASICLKKPIEPNLLLEKVIELLEK